MKVGSPSLRLFRFSNQCLYKSSPRWKGITDVFSYYIAKDMQHLNIVDDKGFRHLLHNIEPLHNCRVNIRAHTIKWSKIVYKSPQGSFNLETTKYPFIISITCHYIADFDLIIIRTSEITAFGRHFTRSS